MNALLSTPDLTSAVTREQAIGAGRFVCGAIGIPGISRDDVVQGLRTSSWGPVVAPVIVDLSHRHLCPGNVYAEVTWPSDVPRATTSPPPSTSTSTSTSPAPPPEPAGPLTSFGSGTWEVGVDVEPGKYKTQGTDTCYWARLRNNDGSSGDIIDNNIGAGPQTVTINEGEYFETQRCGTWTLH